MHRVTIKDLQERLDEARQQRDEARAACAKLKDELREAQKNAGAAIEVATCNTILDAHSAIPVGPYLYSRTEAISHSVSSRLIKLLIKIAHLEGRLYQTIRTSDA